MGWLPTLLVLSKYNLLLIRNMSLVDRGIARGRCIDDYDQL